MKTPSGHSNVRIEELTYNAETEVASVPLEGGATPATVRPLPPLALRRSEWKLIGDRLQWDLSPPSEGGGVLWVQFHDRGGRVKTGDLSRDGLLEARFQCQQMIEELDELISEIDSEDSDAAEDSRSVDA